MLEPPPNTIPLWLLEPPLGVLGEPGLLDGLLCIPLEEAVELVDEVPGELLVDVLGEFVVVWVAGAGVEAATGECCAYSPEETNRRPANQLNSRIETFLATSGM